MRSRTVENWMHFHQLNRRETITLLGGAAVAWPLRARAQQTKAPRIGVLWPGSSGPDPALDAFYRGLREYGYTEGQNIVLERVDANFKLERFPQLAAELVRRKVDVHLRIQHVTGSRGQGSNQHDPHRRDCYGRSCRGRTHR
jgi:hypothetical protein